MKSVRNLSVCWGLKRKRIEVVGFALALPTLRSLTYSLNFENKLFNHEVPIVFDVGLAPIAYPILEAPI